MAADGSDARLPGKSFQGVGISVPYARWRGYGTTHGYHKGRITTYSNGDEDCPEGSFTVVFCAAENVDPITVSWEQVLGIKKHGSVKKACVLDGEPSGVSVATAKQQLAAWRSRAAQEEDQDEEGEDEGEEEGEDGDDGDDEGEDEPAGGAGSVEQLDEAGGGEGDDDGSGGVCSSKKLAKKQRRQRKVQASDPSWQEVDRSARPSRPVETPAFIWRGLKQRATRATERRCAVLL